MAELPRYQQVGSMPGDVPRLDLANVKEQISLTKGVSASLDRLSNFAFKESYEQAQREGMQYGAENQPSLEQVMLAIEEGKSPSELFAKPGTFFGDAARKVQAGQLRIQLETRGREDLSKISAAIEAGPVDLKEITSRIQGMTNGFGKALSSVDPEESLRFRASISTAANAVYTKATDRAAKMYSAEVKVLATDAIATSPTILKDTIFSEPDPAMMAKRIGVERSRIIEIAKQTGDSEFLTSSMADFDKAKMGAVIDFIITPEFASSPQEGFRRVLAGDYGKLSEVMKTVNVDKLKKQYIERTGDIISVNQRANEVNLAVNLDKVQGIKDRLYNGEIGGKEAYRQIRGLGVSLPDGEIKSMLHGDLAGASDQVYGRYESLVEGGTIGEADLDKMGTEGKMSWKQVNTLKNKARNNDPQFNAAIQFIAAEVGVPDPFTPGFGTERAANAKLKAQMLSARDVARRDGQPFNPMMVAQEYVKGYRDSAEGKKYEVDLNGLKNRLEKNGIAYIEGKVYTEQDLKRADVGKNEIKRILDLQKQLGRN